MVRYSENLLEDLVLLSLNNNGTVPGMKDLYRPFRIALRAAVVLELILEGRIIIEPSTGLVVPNTSDTAPSEPPSNPLLAEALHKIIEKSKSGQNRTVTQWIEYFWNGSGIKQFRKRLLAHLSEHKNEASESLLCRVASNSTRLRLSELTTRKRLVNQIRYLLLTDPSHLLVLAETGQAVAVDRGDLVGKEDGMKRQQQVHQIQQQQQQWDRDQEENQDQEWQQQQQQNQGHQRYHFQYNDDDSGDDQRAALMCADHNDGHPVMCQTVFPIDAQPVQYERQSFPSFDSQADDSGQWDLYPELSDGYAAYNAERTEVDDFDFVTDEEANEIRGFVEQKVESLTPLQYVRLKFLVVLLMMDANRFFPRIFERDEVPQAMQNAMRVTQNMPSVKQDKSQSSKSKNGEGSSSSSRNSSGSSISASDVLETTLVVAQVAGIVLYIGLEVLSIGLQIAAAFN